MQTAHLLKDAVLVVRNSDRLWLVVLVPSAQEESKHACRRMSQLLTDVRQPMYARSGRNTEASGVRNSTGTESETFRLVRKYAVAS